jgi:hypothetical protein
MATLERWTLKAQDWLDSLNDMEKNDLTQFEKNLKADLESLLEICPECGYYMGGNNAGIHRMACSRRPEGCQTKIPMRGKNQ